MPIKFFGTPRTLWGLSVALCLFVFPGTSFACAYPPEHYGLPKQSLCLGTWQQFVDLLNLDSTLVFLSADNKSGFSETSPNIFLADMSPHPTLQGASGIPKREKLFLASRELGVYSTVFINVGDAYLIAKK